MLKYHIIIKSVTTVADFFMLHSKVERRKKNLVSWDV
nr:MAG TPA: hypothetical protein [Caudoviricetes sp.]